MAIDNLKIRPSAEVTFEMVLVEGGEFVMGDNSSKHGSEKPERLVELPSFYVGKHLVTEELWHSIQGKDSAASPWQKYPIDQVSWNDVQTFLGMLNNQTEYIFRLPTEAEWEYTASGGRYSQGYQFAGSDKLKQVGWYNENSNGERREIGLLLPNELGVYDMSGNLYEWCEDDYYHNYEGAPKDNSPRNQEPRYSERVMRGGGFRSQESNCRPRYRAKNPPDSEFIDVGFRLALSFSSDDQ